MRVLIEFSDDPAAPDGALVTRELVEMFKTRGLIDVRDEARNPEYFLPSREELEAKAHEVFSALVGATRVTDPHFKYYIGRMSGRVEALLWLLGVGGGDI